MNRRKAPSIRPRRGFERPGQRNGQLSTVILAGTGVIALALLIIVVMLLITRGTTPPGALSQNTPTVTITITSVVGPTDTPQPTLTPTPDIPALLKTARSCKLAKEAVVRLRPSNTSSGAQIGGGMLISVTRPLSNNDGEWYEVVSGGALRFVKREAVKCE